MNAPPPAANILATLTKIKSFYLLFDTSLLLFFIAPA